MDSERDEPAALRIRPAPSGAGFRPEFLDFDRGIHVGNLEENQRITRILKLGIEARYRQSFVTERYGRGVYWRWIGFLARANREAKPLSSGVSFGCSKFFISVEPEEKLFKCGLQVERGFLKAPRGGREWRLQEDWDWNRLLGALKTGGLVDRELARLLKEGFSIFGGSWGSGGETISARDAYPGARKLRKSLEKAPGNDWAGLQVFYPMTPEEVRGSAGPDLVDSMLAVFEEVRPLMNACSQIELELPRNAPVR